MEVLQRRSKEVTLRKCYFHPETPSWCRLSSTSFCFWLGSPGSPHFSFENGQVAPGRSKSKPAGAYCWKASISPSLTKESIVCLFEVENLPEAIREAKKKLRKQNPNYAKTFTELEAEMKREVAEVVKERESGGEIIPIVEYTDIAAGPVSDEVKDKIRRRGVCVIRRVFSPEQATNCDN